MTTHPTGRHSSDWRNASTKKIIEPVTGLRTAVEGILFDAEDFALLSPHKWRLHTDGYILTSDSSKNWKSAIYMHRLIMNAPADMQVDHIDGNKLDNRKSNMRLTLKRGNVCNVPPRKNKKFSQYKGVGRVGKKWIATSRFNGKIRCIGRFDTEIEAAKAYNECVKIHQGEFAWLNPV